MIIVKKTQTFVFDFSNINHLVGVEIKSKFLSLQLLFLCTLKKLKFLIIYI